MQCTGRRLLGPQTPPACCDAGRPGYCERTRPESSEHTSSSLSWEAEQLLTALPSAAVLSQNTIVTRNRTQHTTLTHAVAVFSVPACKAHNFKLTHWTAFGIQFVLGAGKAKAHPQMPRTGQPSGQLQVAHAVSLWRQQQQASECLVIPGAITSLHTTRMLAWQVHESRRQHHDTR
jgi:hypothetical protein